MLSAIFAGLFAFSLLPGRKPLCLVFAEKISGGILPDGAVGYTRALTWVWSFFLAAIAAFNAVAFWWLGKGLAAEIGFLAWVLPSLVSLAGIMLFFLVEKQIRNRKFSAVFHTSGSTGNSKQIVKTFESLAKEVAFHRDFYREYLGGREGETLFVSTIDPVHMYGTLWRVMLPAALGCRADGEIVRSPEALIDKMRAAKHVFLVTTPSFLERFTAYAAEYDIPRNAIEIVTSGAMLDGELSRRTQSIFGIEPRQIYGSTETGGIAARRGETLWEAFAPVKIACRGGRLEVSSPFSFRRRYLTGDAVEMEKGARVFRLKGRVDRLVKINEERVDLAEMEAAIIALGFKEAALSVLKSDRGDMLGAVLVPEISMLAEGAALSPLALRRQMLGIFPKGAVPKKFRIVPALPRNEQGKILRSHIVALLDSALVDPLVRDGGGDDRGYYARIEFPVSAPYFQGHFPSAPVLPGMVQIGFAERTVRRHFHVSAPLRCAKKIKFAHIIEPGKPVDFRLERKSAAEFAYEYAWGGKICSLGVLEF